MTKEEAYETNRKALFYISETIVSESKSEISKDVAIDRIRKYLSNATFKHYEELK